MLQLTKIRNFKPKTSTTKPLTQCQRTMCPLRYIIVVLSLGFILICVVFGASYAPDFVIEAEKKRKEVHT